MNEHQKIAYQRALQLGNKDTNLQTLPQEPSIFVPSVVSDPPTNILPFNPKSSRGLQDIQVIVRPGDLETAQKAWEKCVTAEFVYEEANRHMDPTGIVIDMLEITGASIIRNEQEVPNIEELTKKIAKFNPQRRGLAPHHGTLHTKEFTLHMEINSPDQMKIIRITTEGSPMSNLGLLDTIEIAERIVDQDEDILELSQAA